jgi:hypothetical protein
MPVSKVNARSSPSAGKLRPRSWLADRSATTAYSPNSLALSLSGGFRINRAIRSAATK